MTNFKPTPTNIKLILKNNNKLLSPNRIRIRYCKKILIFLCFLNVYLSKTILYDSPGSHYYMTYFVKPTVVSKFILLRAPFRNKLPKKTFGTTRYNITTTLYFTSLDGKFKLTSLSSLRDIYKFFYKFSSLFETNICSQHKNLFSVYLTANLINFKN